MSDIKGPFESVGAIALGVVGMYMGYKLGSEAVEYAKRITDPDVIGYVVYQHPGITKLVTTLAVGELMAEIGRLPGGLVDVLFGTRKSE